MSQDKSEGARAVHAHELGEFFKNHLSDHLTKNLAENPQEENHPARILKKAQKTPGILSRIFDTFNFPVLPYEDIKEISGEPNGLTEYMREILSEIFPVILNENRNALHPNVIDAINATGENNYSDILKGANDNEQDIANHFVKAVILGYSERVLDNIRENPDHAARQQEAFLSVLKPLEQIAKEATVTGLPEQKQTMASDTLQQIIDQFIALHNEAKEASIEIDGRFIGEHLDLANSCLKLGKTDDALKSYDNAVELFVANMQQQTPVKPKEVSWFKKILRFITRNEKLLQNYDEKRYEKQLTLLPKLHDLKKKLNKTQGQEPENEQKQDKNPTLKS